MVHVQVVVTVGVTHVFCEFGLDTEFAGVHEKEEDDVLVLALRQALSPEVITVKVPMVKDMLEEETEITELAVQPLLSDTFTVNEPELKPVAVCVV